MANNLIHLWDNSWHAPSLDESVKDSFGRKPRPLNKKVRDDSVLCTLSSTSIGDLMKDEGCDVLVWPYSFQDSVDEIKNQCIFQISEKNGKNIDSLTTGNVVGFIGKGNTHIRIHSRFSSDVNKGGNVNDYFLYYMLGRVMAANWFNLDTSSSAQDSAFDFLLFFFPKLLKEALSQGMYKKYVYHEYNDANIRGVIDVNRHIRLNIPVNGKIAYRTREFCYDNPVTQLIRHTIEFIRRKSFGKSILHNDPDTEACVQQIIQATPTYQAQQRQAVITENLRPVIHPFYTKYTALQKLCLRILRHEKLSYGQANDNKIHGILIDAAWLWEEYVGRILSEKGTGLAHYTRSSRFRLLQTTNGKHFQQVIPDYYDKENELVADAKYIPLHRYDHLDADRAAAVYYKTIMCMYRFDTKVGFLFHPCSQEDATYVKTNKYLSHLEIKEKTISCNYQIEGREDCHLHEIGMIIPTTEKYEEFQQSMNEVEYQFISQIENCITLKTTQL